MDFLPHLLPLSPWTNCSQVEKWLEFFIFKKVNKAIAYILDKGPPSKRGLFEHACPGDEPRTTLNTEIGSLPV